MTQFKRINLDDILAFKAKNPAIHNYIDLNITTGEFELDDYHVYKGESGETSGIVGISPNNTFNIYCDDYDLGIKLVSKAQDLHGTPQLIVGQAKFNDYIKKTYPQFEFKPFFYMAKKLKKLNPSSEYQVRKASSSDLELVRKWYLDFNEEQRSSWDVPTKEMIEKKNYFLFFQGDKWLGGCSQGIAHEKRFWIGRFHIEKDSRRQGHGNHLLKILENMASMTHESMDLLVNNDNQEACAFYLGNGFKTVSENAYWFVR